jgi:hypothetical protein
VEIGKFLAVRRVGLMTHHEYRVDRPFPVTWLGNVWEPFGPPPAVQAWADYLTLTFRA